MPINGMERKYHALPIDGSSQAEAQRSTVKERMESVASWVGGELGNKRRMVPSNSKNLEYHGF